MSNKVIEIKDLSFAYPDGTHALKDINFHVFEGETIGIIGANGAGKSTFLLHLNGILRGIGEIRILDKEMSDENMNFIRRHVGLVFQDPDNQLFMPTVFEDVAFGPLNMELPKDEIERAVDTALTEVDMSSSAKRSSHHLSFGEKKRISIATVLSMDPDILVLDEPSSNIDPKHRRELITLLNGLQHTKIIATHDLELVNKCCTRVAIFHDGKIPVVDTVANVLENEKMLDEYGLR